MTNAERVLGQWVEDPRCVAAFDAIQDRRSPTGRLEAIVGSNVKSPVPAEKVDVEIQEEIPVYQRPLGGNPQKPYYENFRAGKKATK